MSIFAYYSPRRAAPVNVSRAGTIRMGTDQPTFIKVNKGYANDLIFAFKDEKQKAFWLEGKTVTAKFFNKDNVELLSKDMKIIVDSPSIGHFILTPMDTNSWETGLYNLVITYTDAHGDEYVMQTSHSLPRFVINVI